MVDQKAINIWTARVVPIILIGIAAYSTFTVVGPLCVDYLLNPPVNSPRGARPAAAIAILVLLFVFLFCMATTYFRTLYTVAFNPGYVPRPPKADGNGKSMTQGTSDTDVEKNAVGGALTGHSYKNTKDAGSASSAPEHYGLAQFYEKEVFVCEGNGLPRWCSVCKAYKPDRAHHCREIARCVRKMDHFCPWVGGIVSETNFKFFVQFTASTALFCTFTLIVLAIYIAEYRRDSGFVNIHWAVTLGFGSFFSLFTIGMTLSSLHYMLVNTTSVEDLSRKVKVWTIAVHIKNPPPAGALVPYQTITYPLDSMIDIATPVAHRRQFAVLHSRPGESIFDVGPLANFKSVMGESFLDWFSILKYSPCCNHSSGESAFPLGPAVQRMMREAGLLPQEDSKEDSKESLRRHRRRHQRSERQENNSARNDGPDPPRP